MILAKRDTEQLVNIDLEVSINKVEIICIIYKKNYPGLNINVSPEEELN